jgi:hypothetical protein
MLQLSEEQSKQKGLELCGLIEDDLRARETVVKRRAMMRDLYAGLPDSAVNEEGVTIHLPVIAEKVDGTTPKIVNAFWNADPIVHVIRMAEEYNSTETDNVERFMNWALISDIVDAYMAFEQWVRNALIDGVSVIKVFWDYAERETVLTKRLPIFWRAGETDYSNQPVPEERVKLPIELLGDLFGTDPRQRGIAEISRLYKESESRETEYDHLKEVDTFDGLIAIVDIVENRIRYDDVEVRFEECEYIDEIAVTIKRPVIYRDCPRLELVEFDDLVVPFRTASLDPVHCPRVTHICYYTMARIKSYMNNCGWDLSDEDMEALASAASTKPEQYRYEDGNTSMKEQKDQQIGEDDGLSLHGAEHGTYDSLSVMVYEVYASDDVNDDGEPEEVIYIIPAPLRRVVRSYYLDELFPHGRRPFCDLHYRKSSDRFYSTGMAEMLVGINLEADAIISMVNYAQEIINNPWFFYEPTAFLDQGDIPKRGLRPGEGRKVASVNGIMFPKFMQEPLANLSTLDSLLLFADRLTLSPQSVGSSQVRNSPRTARGTIALLSEAGIKLDMLITAAQYGPWRELLHQIHALYMTFGPDEKYYYVTGSPAPRRVTQDQLRGRYQFTFSGNTTNTNKEVMRSISQQRYATLVSNPLYTMDLKAMQALIKDFLKHFSEGTDITTLIPNVPQTAVEHSPMDQKTEIRYILQGTPLGILATDDHAQHITDLMAFQNSQEFKMIEPWQAAMLAVHGAQHAQALQKMQMSSGMQINQQAAGGAGQANNVPTEMGGDQGSQYGNMEGGVQ